MSHDRISKRRNQKSADKNTAGSERRNDRAHKSSTGLGPHYASGPAVSLGIPVQTKLTVGPADDSYEREADAVAQRVTAGGNGSSSSAVSTMQTKTPVRRQAEEEPVQRQTEEEPVQRQAAAEEPVQRQVAEEEPVQRQAEDEPVQRQVAEEESVQRQVEEEPVQRQAEDEPVQRQVAEEESIQRQVEEEPVQRKGSGGPHMTAGTASTIHHPGPGRPLASQVRQRIEPQVGADLKHVRVHTGSGPSRAAANLNAHAFTHGSDIFLSRGASPNDTRLMAHEATHVVQQGAARGRGRSGQGASTPNVQRLLGIIMDELNDYARHIPGYTLFTVIIGFNPLLGERVERNAINLLEGLMGLVPFGTFIFDKLSEMGIIQDAFAWVEGELNRLDLSLGRIERTIEDVWDEVSLLEGFEYNLNIARRHFGRLYDDVISFAESLVNHIIELIKEAAISAAEGLLAENKAWDLIKKILKYDPLRDEPVEATTVEILEDFLMLIGKETELEQMRERGTLQETADWLDTQFATFMGLLAQLSSLISAAWDAIQPENLPNLMSNLEALATQTFSFLQQVWDFALTVALQVLELIKNALLSWLSEFAHEVPGFHLITVIIGRNPFTGEAVPRTAENLIRGFITLIPGGNAIYDQMYETGVIPQAAARIEGAVAELGISWEFIVGIFTGIWDSLSIDDLIDPIGAFTRIRDQFGEPISRLFTFIRIVIEELFKLILALMNFPVDLISSIITNAMQAFENIKNDPIGFFMNMLQAVKLGFTNFFDNILTHLVGGLADWLFRGLRDAGIEPPTDLSLESVLNLVLQVLGLSMDRLWQKVAERVGQETVDRIRGAIDRLVGIWNFVRDVQERGVVAIWEYIQSQISNLWDMILQKAQEWIMERIINRAIQWLLSMLDPTGIMAVVNSFMAFFRAVQSAIEYLRDILEIINDYVTTIAAIARGDVQPGAEKMERGLANAIPIAIGFLANQFGLGNIAEKVQEIIAGIRAFVDRALDWLLDQAERALQGLMRMLGLGGEGDEPPRPDVANMTPEQRKEAAKSDVENSLASGMPGERIYTLLEEVKQRYALSEVSIDRSNPETPRILYYASNPISTSLTHPQPAQPSQAAGAGGTSRLSYSNNPVIRTPYGAVKDKYGDDTIRSKFAVKEENWQRPGTSQATIVGDRPGGRRSSVIGKSGKVGKDEHYLATGNVQSYDGGHLIGLQLAGVDTNDASNLAPQIGSFNRGTYLQIENLVKNSPLNSANQHESQIPINLTVSLSYPGVAHTIPFSRLRSLGVIRSNATDQGSVTIPRRVPSRWRMEIQVQQTGFHLSSVTPSSGTQMESQAQGTAPEASSFIQPGDRFIWFRVGTTTSSAATTVGGSQDETIVAEQETP